LHGKLLRKFLPSLIAPSGMINETPVFGQFNLPPRASIIAVECSITVALGSELIITSFFVISLLSALVIRSIAPFKSLVGDACDNRRIELSSSVLCIVSLFSLINIGLSRGNDDNGAFEERNGE
uniref:AA_permease domain-containing protein n=1 Tax=Brugia timori TaxID=42155 RepID=A0A0R3R6Z4_9BILA